MLVTTTDLVPGRHVTETLGLVRGSAMRSRNLFQDLTEWLRNLVGAELTHYTKMMAETREQALDRMQDQARALGADAVIGVRIVATNITRGAGEFVAYGTAVRLG